MNRVFIGLLVIALSGSIVSCDFFQNTDQNTAIARVNNTYLYQDDIKNLIGEGTSEADSIVLVTNYINRWATQQLLLNGAKLNLSEKEQNEFLSLVEQYEKDLFTKAYLEALVNKNLDSIITDAEANTYFNDNASIFTLNENIVQFRYLSLEPTLNDISEFKQRLIRFNQKDKSYLDSIAVRFKSYNFNDSIWVKQEQIIRKIPILTIENRDGLLKKSNFIELKDSIGVYLIYIKDVLLRNDPAPLQYVRPTINQIVVNKRKLELIKDLKKEITKDAITSKKFEIYNQN